MRFLIIGQGLAGTLLGFRLERHGHRVDYVDAPGETAASAVAAGIVNPVTGRRFVKSWRIDDLLPEASALYRELETALGGRYWYDLPLVRTLYNRGDRNDWEARSGDPAYAAFLDDNPELGRLPELTAPVFAYGGVRHAARVAVGTLVRDFRQRLLAGGRFRAEDFAYGQLADTLAAYDHVICCEGWRARHNPYFGYLPHGGNKGEVLIVRTAAPPLEQMFKHRVFLVPRADGTYWVGATSENRFSDDRPTAAQRTFLERRLREVLTVPFEVVAHRAAVRPTVRDRRPFLGRHPEVANLWIFNGLGTKGASLAPLSSRWLTAAILEGAPLPAEVDIARFAPH